MASIKGYIERITFHNEENGFTVARLKEPKKLELTVVVGNMPSIQEGETVSCEGSWKNDKNYGLQFQVDSYQITRPSSINGIKKYLSSGLIKGIGDVFAERIVDYHGKDTLDIIDKNPDALLQVDGIGKKRIDKIKECWAEQRSIREVMLYLQTNNVSPVYAQKIYKQYQENAIPIIANNPFKLAQDVWGIGFKTADKIAKQIGFKHDDPKRIDAGVEYVLFELSSKGHTCYPKNSFIEEAEKLLSVAKADIDNRLNIIALENRIIVADKDEEEYLWLSSFYHAEKGIAKELHRLAFSPSLIKIKYSEKIIADVQQKLNIQLATQQLEAVKNSLLQKLHIITGGPGTGKSTITKVIIQLFSEVSDKIVLASPTGKAAKRLAEITKREAKTLHSLLEFDFKINGFKRNKTNPIEADLIIVDEASMIDNSLMYSLLKAVSTQTALIFVGDIDQLPSVGAGNVLKDIIETKNIAVTKLTEIFRQAASSKIITNAHKINKGFFPDTKIEQNSDFFFIEEENTDNIAELIGDLVSQRLPKKYGYDNMKDIQVLTPMRRGVIGTNNLNILLQKKLNPSYEPLQKGGRNFHKKDKVMQIKNNYDKDIFNGDVGYISKIDYTDQELFIKFDTREICYDFSELDQIQHAYAVSIHKFQGSESPCVVIPIHTSHYTLLFKNLLYTGITRGKELVVLIGSKRAIYIAIKNNKVAERNTGLKEQIIEKFKDQNISIDSLFNKEIKILKM